MATIDECYRLLKYRATKSGFNGNLGPNDFNLIWNRAEQRHFNNEYKKYLINQESSDSLIVFKTDPLTIVVDSNGKYTKPAGVLHVDAIRAPYMDTEVEVVRVEDDRLANHLNSTYDNPTAEFPIYTEYKAYIQFNPKDLTEALLVYLKALTPAKWAYTLVNDRPVYDNANSVQPLWRENDIDEVIYLCGTDLGLNLRDQQTIQMNDRLAKENA